MSVKNSRAANLTAVWSFAKWICWLSHRCDHNYD